MGKSTEKLVSGLKAPGRGQQIVWDFSENLPALARKPASTLSGQTGFPEQSARIRQAH
jgi:hypothetical protein